MIALITLEEAKSYLRYDTDEDDPILETLIGAASDAVLSYIKEYEVQRFLVLDSSGEVLNVDSSGVVTDVPDRVKAACLMSVHHYDDARKGNRDNETAVPTAYGYGYSLPFGATALLFAMRRPTVA